MKTLNKRVCTTVVDVNCSTAIADCPLNLPTKYLQRCLVVEGSASEYPSDKVMVILHNADLRINKMESE